jgi:hypothetical protein
MITIDVVKRIERALRETIHEEEILDVDGIPNSNHETIQDREFIRQLYSHLKTGHSFSWASRIARTAFISKVLGAEFDLNAELDKGY